MSRFFAQILSFRCECPACGRLHIISQSGQHAARYDRVTATLRCANPKCRRAYQVGLVLYPVTLGIRVGQPADQRPTVAQLAELRDVCRGWFQEGHRKRARESGNIVAEWPCSCQETGVRLCPVHGKTDPDPISLEPPPDDDEGEGGRIAARLLLTITLSYVVLLATCYLLAH